MKRVIVLWGCIILTLIGCREKNNSCDRISNGEYELHSIMIDNFHLKCWRRPEKFKNNSDNLRYSEMPQSNFVTSYLSNETETLIKSFIEQIDFSNFNREVLDSVPYLVLYATKKIQDTIKLTNIDKVLVYAIRKGKMYGLVFNKNSNGQYLLDSKQSGITNLISLNDIYVIAENKSTHPSFLVISNYINFKNYIESGIKYITDFQIKNSYKQNGGEGGGGIKCKETPECEKLNGNLPYVAVESQGGPTSFSCGGALGPIIDACMALKVKDTLKKEPFAIHHITEIIKILRDVRDNFLYSTFKGWKYIDNYYFLSAVIQYNQIPSSVLFKVKELTENNFFNKLSLLNSTNNSDIVLITPFEKNILLSIINDLKKININTSYQYVLTQLENDIMFYEGKNIQQIQNDFKLQEF